MSFEARIHGDGIDWTTFGETEAKAIENLKHEMAILIGKIALFKYENPIAVDCLGMEI